MSEDLVYIDGGDPIPSDKLAEWVAEWVADAKRLGLRQDAVLGGWYLMTKADAYRGTPLSDEPDPGP